MPLELLLDVLELPENKLKAGPTAIVIGPFLHYDYDRDVGSNSN